MFLYLFISACKAGTVGAVALDKNGHIAAATSTGGMNGKMVGRIGDTPQIGCGTYADDFVGGVSTTGKYNQPILNDLSLS